MTKRYEPDSAADRVRDHLREAIKIVEAVCGRPDSFTEGKTMDVRSELVAAVVQALTIEAQTERLCLILEDITQAAKRAAAQ